MLNRYIILSFVYLLILTSCFKEENSINMQQNNLKKVPQKKWDRLSNQRIYFGHQSVGYNIMDGIDLLLKENSNIKLNIKKGKSVDLFDTPVFAHDNNGSNRDPKLKIDDFCNAMESGLGTKVNMAGFKFCYVDLEEGSDVTGLFNHYKKRMDEISLKYPNVKIIHFTCPIKSLQSGAKGFIKKILGKDIGIKDNMVRQQFNQLLVKEYKDQPIFDIAKLESTYPDGSREFKLVDGKTIYNMIPAYTNDGGHLSTKGKIIIGSKFLIFLAEL